MRHGTSPAVALAMIVILRGCGSDGRTPTTPPAQSTDTVALRQVAGGLDFPVYLTAPAGDQRLFIAEKTGRIRIVKAGTLAAAPFLDLSASVSGGSEQGLLGLAFDPAYATTGRFYVDYTDRNGDTRIARFRVTADPDVADASSEEILLTIDQPYANHNGGQLAFGPDGYLYVGMGDGGSGGDPQGHGQNPNDLLGSLLRLDVSSATGYTVPAANPVRGRRGPRRGLQHRPSQPVAFQLRPAGRRSLHRRCRTERARGSGCVHRRLRRRTRAQLRLESHGGHRVLHRGL